MPDENVPLLQGERRVLEMVATSAPLRETLEALATLIESQEPDLRCGVLVVAEDGAHFSDSFGPSLPDVYHEALAGLPITPPYIGACGEVAHRGEPVLLSNVTASDRYTARWRNLMSACGLASMSSFPITAADGKVLGSFAMYFPDLRDPRPSHPRLVELATHLARIALERDRSSKLAAARDARLQASARQFAELIENAPFGTYVVDAEFRLAQASQSARTTFGIDDLIGMELGEALRKIWPESFASKAIERFRHTLSTGEPFIAKDTVEQRADINAVEAYEWRVERIMMPDGRFGVVCYFYDLSSRHQIEADLRESEARFASAFDQAPSFMAMLSGPDYVIEIANPNYLKLVGNRDVIGRRVADALPEAASQGYLDLLDHVYRTGTAYAASSSPFSLQTASGAAVEEHFLDFVYQPITDASGKVTRIFVEGFDVTDRIMAEKKLRESEERFRLIVSSARDFAIVTLDMEGRITSWNSGAEQMMGYAEAEIIGKPTTAFFTPEDIAAGVPDNELTRAQAAGRAENERWHVRRDGSRFWGSGVIMPLSDGNQRGYLKIFQDKTLAHEAGARLEHAVKERTRELETAQTKLAHAQRMEALGQLAGGIAHDFNNALQTVQGAAGLIERRPADVESVRRLARMISDAALRGSAITRRLLAFSHRGDLRSEAVSPAALLTDLREILSHTLGPGIEIRVDAPASLPALMVDKSQLETVLINLATNARDAMDANGRLTLTAALDVLPKSYDPRPAIELAAGNYVRLSVADTGAGMTPEILARVTEPFFTTKEKGRGTGLGLAMTRGFIEQSGGAIWIESQYGHGTTVHAWLPTADALPEQGASGNPVKTNRQDETRRLLVVDDEPLVREIIARQLEAAKYDVVSAAGAQEALLILDVGAPIDLIVCDLSMPGMDGIEFLREASQRRPKLPAILLTGFATNAAEIAVSGAMNGMLSLLRKPVTEDELVERVAILLQGATEA